MFVLLRSVGCRSTALSEKACYKRRGERLLMIVLVYILDSIAKGITLFPQFFAWYIPSLRPHSFIFALVPHIFDGLHKRSYAHAYMHRLASAALRPWWIMLETLPIFLFFYSPIIHLFFFFIILFFSIMPVLILQILILRCDTQSRTDNTQTNNDTNYNYNSLITLFSIIVL